MQHHDNTGGTQTKTDGVVSMLQKEIATGRFAGAAVLPGERELATLLGVSRTTLRRAMVGLVRAGVLGQRRGYGTFVIRQEPAGAPRPERAPFATTLSVLRGPGEHLMQRGEATGFRSMTTGLFLPTLDEALHLETGPGERVWRASRLWLGTDGEPLAAERCTATCRQLDAAPPDPSDWPGRLADRGSGIVRLQKIVRTVALEAGDAVGSPESTSGIIVVHRGFDAAGDCLISWSLRRRWRGFEESFETVFDRT